MTRRFRPRKEFKFWLYHDIEGEVRLMEYIEFLRRTRQFAKTIRNGLRLMWTLGEGDLSVLFELFPTLRRQLAPDNAALLEEFRQMLQAAYVPQFAPSESVADGSVHALPAPRAARPTLDDEEDTVILRRDTSAGDTAGRNFLSAAFGFQGRDAPGNDPSAIEMSSGTIREIRGMKDIAMPTFDDDDP